MDIPNQKYYLRVRCRLYPANERKGVLDEYTINQLYISMKRESVSMPTAKLSGEKRIPRREHRYPGNIIHDHERWGRNDLFQTIHLPG